MGLSCQLLLENELVSLMEANTVVELLVPGYNPCFHQGFTWLLNVLTIAAAAGRILFFYYFNI
jgi:hypothetical protein